MRPLSCRRENGYCRMDFESEQTPNQAPEPTPPSVASPAQEPRPPASWLIFDVGQNTMHAIAMKHCHIVTLALCLAGCASDSSRLPLPPEQGQAPLVVS